MTRPRHRRLLAWLRLEDEHGMLSLTAAALFFGVAWLVIAPSWFSLVAFAAGVLGYQAKCFRRGKLAQLGIDGANRYSLAQLTLEHNRLQVAHGTEVKELGEKMKSLESRVGQVLTPERVEALQKLLRGGRG